MGRGGSTESVNVKRGRVKDDKLEGDNPPDMQDEEERNWQIFRYYMKCITDCYIVFN